MGEVLAGWKVAVAAQAIMFGVPSRFLSYWLIGAASLRMLSVFIGVFNPDTFKKRVYRLRCELFRSRLQVCTVRSSRTWLARRILSCVTHRDVVPLTASPEVAGW